MVRRIVRRFHPERIILYGSLAQRRVHEWSDADLVMIKRTTLAFSGRLGKMPRPIQPRLGAGKTPPRTHFVADLLPVVTEFIRAPGGFAAAPGPQTNPPSGRAARRRQGKTGVARPAVRAP
ncbi:MAG: nucleotidyltransferase domain-containing protein [Burkholderiaceae bacterium]|nr:nucleotidyltransferase domain-containing protein [Burkholderiaceae bacterium]